MEYQVIRIEHDGTQFFVDQYPTEEEAQRAIDNDYLNQERVHVKYRVRPVHGDIWEKQ